MAEIPDGFELTPFDETFYHDPWPVYERLRRLDPVHKDKISFYEKSWTISDYETVKTLLTDNRLSVDPRTIGLRRDPRADNPVTMRAPGMMNLDGKDHHRLRLLVQKAFTPSSIRQFEGQIEQIVSDCLEQITDNTFDVVTEIAKPVPTIVIADYIGVDSRDHLQFKAWTDSLLKQGYPMPTEDQWNEIVSADQAFRAHVTGVIEERRINLESDLISRLIIAGDEDQSLTENEIVDMCCLLIGAGNFTTTDLISNTIFNLLMSASEAEAAAIVEETLRSDPPSMAVRRYVTEPVECGGQQIPQGSVVSLLTGAANHDPAQFSQPDRFNPEQDNDHHLAFGRGIHHCLGAALARLEASITVKQFRERFPGASIELAERHRRMDFRGFRKLIVNTG